ncbi:MAG TPA: fructose bisphosphate aldolase [Polyangiaceae bacterium]|nr:fructose bisphosphate aldolase [Polyangiaceae bacterium]
MTTREEQRATIKSRPGFIAALDQSGGSTPKALSLYGITESAWSTEQQMFDLVHEMRTRIIKSSAFGSARIVAAILFENTMDRSIDGEATADFLWRRKKVVPILKIDQGLAAQVDGVELMKPIPGLFELLERAVEKNIFGTKMRSVIKLADPGGIEAVVDQQFEFAERILERGLCPIIEPEVDIKCPEKSQAEQLLKEALIDRLGQLPKEREIMFKLTLPEVDNFYIDFVLHPQVLKVVALSGGYSRTVANERLSRQKGVIASFSRALTEGLSAQQTAADFDQTLDASIQSIYLASIT